MLFLLSRVHLIRIAFSVGVASNLIFLVKASGIPDLQNDSGEKVHLLRMLPRINWRLWPGESFQRRPKAISGVYGKLRTGFLLRHRSGSMTSKSIIRQDRALTCMLKINGFRIGIRQLGFRKLSVASQSTGNRKMNIKQEKLSNLEFIWDHYLLPDKLNIVKFSSKPILYTDVV